MQRSVTSLLVLLLVLFSPVLFAQETTATINGFVTDAAGAAVNGASVTVTYQPTNNVIQAITNSKGRFVITNLKAGGPYTISIAFIGFQEETLNDINLILGENPAMDVTLKSASAELKEVVVSSAGRRGAVSGLTVGRAQLNTLPTLGRSLQDFTRLTPQSNNNSFAGSNFRYNNITLDGAVNNDAIGFSNSFGGVSGGGQSGTAGSGTRTNPYSLDVIQEVQVQLAPYDVKLGNFTGGSVNAVTKSGGNDFHGSVYGYGRNQTLVGKSVDGRKTSIGSDFYDYQYGATISGPIIKNKLFFIVNGEITRRQEPTFYNAGDPGAAVSLADAQSIAAAFRAQGFEPGTYDRYKIFTNSDKFFGRIDWNINSKSNLTLRAIYTNGEGNNLERSSTNFQFSSTDFTQHTKNLNLVGELKTRFSNNVSNDLIASYINVHDYRDFPGATPSPYVDINSAVWLGTWREAAIYNTRQKTFELTDNVTYTKGINKFTFGTHNEFYDIDYGFIQSWNGRWQYSSITNFLDSMPSRIRGTYTTDYSKNNFDNLQNNLPSSEFHVGLMSAYVQDEIAISRKFKITPGVRLDYSFVSKQPATDTGLNKIADYNSANPTYSHTSFSQLNNNWLGNATLSPRLGFNWDIKGNQSIVLRGGSGIFTGRIPFAWLGYAYTLNGADFGNIDFNKIAVKVPLSSPDDLKGAVDAATGSNANTKTRELDINDNNFKLPTIWRSNIATDIKFGKGYKLTLDAMYTKTLQDVKFQQINLKDSVAYFSTGPTQSPVFVGGKVNSDYLAIYLLTNTTQGYRYNLTAQLSKTSNNMKMGINSTVNINWSVAYTYGRSKDVSNGIRNSFSSNYEYNPAINPNSPTLANSNFDMRSRIVAIAGASFNWSETNTTSVNFFYSGQAGSPYTVVYGSNPFGTGSSVALPYIPKTQSDINLADVKSADGTTVVYSAAQQWADLNSFIEGDKYLKTRRGQYAERNGLHTPWNHELDMKLMHTFKLSKTNNQHTLQISFDVFNVLNLLNNDWGHIRFVTNTNNYTVNLLNFANDINGVKPGAPTATGGYIPTFTFAKPAGIDNHYYTVDPINSRWQGQLGIKYNF